MNTTKKNLLALVFVLVSSVTYSWAQSCCSSGSKGGAPSAQIESSEASAEGLISYYLKVKDALVKSDAKLTEKEALKMYHFVSKSGVHNSKLDKAIQNLTKAPSLSAQRKAFSLLSDTVYDYRKGISGENTIYRQYCPMALNNTGGYWLSTEKQVVNPYFGDRMLHCGRTVEKLN